MVRRISKRMRCEKNKRRHVHSGAERGPPCDSRFIIPAFSAEAKKMSARFRAEKKRLTPRSRAQLCGEVREAKAAES